MKKRGQLLQIVFIMVLIVAVALTLMVATKVLNSFWTALEEGGVTTEETNSTKVAFAAVPATFDYGMLFIMVGLTIGLVVTSFQIPTHPIFMVVNFFGIFFLVFLAMTISNLYGEIIAGEDAQFTTEAESYPVTNFIVNYLPYICVLITFISTVVMFAKGQSEGGM